MNRLENLQDIKDLLEKAKKERDSLKGELNILEKQLRDDFGIKNLEIAEKRLNEISSEIEMLEEERDELMDKAREILEIIDND